MEPVEVFEVLDAYSILSWMQGMKFLWPQAIIEQLTKNEGTLFARARVRNETMSLRISPHELLGVKDCLKEMLGKIIFTPEPASSKLPFSYQRVPHRIRWLVASMLVRINKLRIKRRLVFPQWPLDLSVDALNDILTVNSGDLDRHPQAYVLLTHDIDTPESLKYLPGFLEVEESFGVHSTNFVVPCGWDIDHGILERAFGQGHEIGIHGFNHDNRTPFLPRDEMAARIESAAALMTKYAAKGYRAPSLLRSKLLIDVLANYFTYDSSIPNTDGFYSGTGTGCATARPFHLGSLIEIPLTLPSDANLLFQGFRPGEILSLWMDSAKKLIRSGGIVHLLTHCEKRYSGNKTMLGIYREFVSFLKSNALEFKTLAEAASQKRTCAAVVQYCPDAG